MFPWDHLAIGYVAYSLAVRLFGDRPTDGAWLAVVVGSQFPDLVDKPLAWTFGVLPSGTSLAHSVLVAVPLSAAVAVAAARRGAGRAGAAFGLAYLLHLPADVLYGPLVTGDLSRVGVDVLLWPLVPQPAGGATAGLLASVAHYVGRYYVYLQSPEALGYLLLEVTFLGLALALWVADGRPGAAYLRRPVRAVRGEPR